MPLARANVRHWFNIRNRTGFSRHCWLRLPCNQNNGYRCSLKKKLSSSNLSRSFTFLVLFIKVVLFFFRKIPADRAEIISWAGGPQHLLSRFLLDFSSALNRFECQGGCIQGIVMQLYCSLICSFFIVLRWKAYFVVSVIVLTTLNKLLCTYLYQ